MGLALEKGWRRAMVADLLIQVNAWYRPLVDRQPFEELHGMFWTRPGGHSSPHQLSSVLVLGSRRRRVLLRLVART